MVRLISIHEWRIVCRARLNLAACLPPAQTPGILSCFSSVGLRVQTVEQWTASSLPVAIGVGATHSRCLLVPAAVLESVPSVLVRSSRPVFLQPKQGIAPMLSKPNMAVTCIGVIWILPPATNFRGYTLSGYTPRLRTYRAVDAYVAGTPSGWILRPLYRAPHDRSFDALSPQTGGHRLE
jgi:hypothetical protein